MFARNLQSVLAHPDDPFHISSPFHPSPYRHTDNPYSMDFPHGGQSRYDEYGLSPQEKAYLIAKRRHEAAERERERLQALAEVERRQRVEEVARARANSILRAQKLQEQMRKEASAKVSRCKYRCVYVRSQLFGCSRDDGRHRHHPPLPHDKLRPLHHRP
jgi:hypothetical protein